MNAVLRVAVLKADVEGEAREAARANDRVAKAMVFYVVWQQHDSLMRSQQAVAEEMPSGEAVKL